MSVKSFASVSAFRLFYDDVVDDVRNTLRSRLGCEVCLFFAYLQFVGCSNNGTPTGDRPFVERFFQAGGRCAWL